MEGDTLANILLGLVVLALVAATISLLRERRLRLALQTILQRLISKWRAHENSKDDDRGGHRNIDSGGHRM